MVEKREHEDDNPDFILEANSVFVQLHVQVDPFACQLI